MFKGASLKCSNTIKSTFHYFDIGHYKTRGNMRFDNCHHYKNIFRKKNSFSINLFKRAAILP